MMRKKWVDGTNWASLLNMDAHRGVVKSGTRAF